MDNLALNKTNTNKFFINLQVFLAPVITIYIVSIVGVISANGGTIKLVDFIPTQFVWGGITLYFLNSILDYLKKIRSEQ